MFAANITKTTTRKVTCSRCQSDMVLDGEQYVCPNCGFSVSANAVTAAFEDASVTSTPVVTTEHSLHFEGHHAAALANENDTVQLALAGIRRTGLYTLCLGVADALLTVVLAVSGTSGNIQTVSVVLSGLFSLLLICSGFTIRTITANNAHYIERLIEITAFAIIALGAIALIAGKGSGRAYPLLPILLLGSLTRSITAAKRLQA